MRRRPSILLCALALVGLGLQPAPQQPTPVKSPKPAPTPPPVLEGSVRDTQGRAVPDATIGLRSVQSDWTEPPLSARTDAKGGFQLALKDAGPYTVRVEAKGWAAVTLEKVRPGAPIRVILSRGTTIQGVVRDGSSGQPVPGARVEARDSRSMALAWEPDAGTVSAVTDDKGRFRLEGLGNSMQAIVASARGYGSARKNDTRPQSGGVELYLFPGASVSGLVQRSDGQPVPGAIVRAEFESFGTPPPRAAVTGADGRYEIAGLQTGIYRVVARHRDFAPAVSAKLAAEAGGDLGADLVLEAGHPLTGRLTQADGEPVAGRVSVIELKGEPAPRSLVDLLRGEAGLDGRFRLSVPSGDHKLGVVALGYSIRQLDARVERREAETDLGDIPLETGLAIRGRVRDKSGAGIGGARLSAFPSRPSGPGNIPLDGRSESDGSFVIGGLQPGNYRVSVRASGYGETTRPFDAGTEKADFLLTPAGAITGQVVDDEAKPVELFRLTSRPAPMPSTSGVIVGSRFQDVSGSDGRFTLEDVAEGTHVLTVSAPERLPATVSEVKVAAGGSTDVGRVRVSAGGTIRGTVADTNGAPVIGAAVGVRGQGRESGAGFAPQTVSDTSGAFEIRGAPTGTVELTANHPNYAEGRSAGVEVDPAKGPSEAHLVLAEGGRVEGFVRTRDGRAPSSVAITVVPVRREGGSVFGGSGPRVHPIRDDGGFTAEHLAGGRVQVMLMNLAGSTYTTAQSREVEVQNGVTTSVNFVSQDILVSGRVTRAGGPASGLRVNARAEQGFMVSMSFSATAPFAQPGPQRGTAVTRDDGSYELIAGAPGKTTVSVTTADGRSSLPSRSVVIPDADAYTLDLDFGGASVSGVLVDEETDAPVAQVDVFATPKNADPPGMLSRAVSGADGRFELELEPGQYRLNARAPDSDYSPATTDVEVSTTGAPQIRLALKRGVSIAGTVVDASGRGVGNLSVIAQSSDPTRSSGNTSTQPDGSFRFRGLAQGAHALLARSDLGAFAVRTGVMPGEKDVVLSLRKGGQVRVRVVGPDEKPLDKAFVVLVRYRGAPLNGVGAQTDAQGIAQFMVPAGSLELRGTKEKLQATVTVSVAEGETATLALALGPPPGR